MNFRENLFLLLWNSLSSLIKWRGESKPSWWEPKLHTSDSYRVFLLLSILYNYCFFLYKILFEKIKSSVFKNFFENYCFHHSPSWGYWNSESCTALPLEFTFWNHCLKTICWNHCLETIGLKRSLEPLVSLSWELLTFSLVLTHKGQLCKLYNIIWICDQ